MQAKLKAYSILYKNLLEIIFSADNCAKITHYLWSWHSSCLSKSAADRKMYEGTVFMILYYNTPSFTLHSRSQHLIFVYIYFRMLRTLTTSRASPDCFRRVATSPCTPAWSWPSLSLAGCSRSRQMRRWSLWARYVTD